MRILFAVPLLGVAGCFGEASLDGLPCPCAEGWTCCETQGVCVRDQAQCPADEPDAGSLPGPELSVLPESARLRLGGAQTFTASTSVTWSVDELNGGVIDASGEYRAPLRPGVYHVRAKSADDQTQLVSVTVGPQELGVAAGRPGGDGHADGFGADVRFRGPRNIVGDAAFLYVNDTYSIRRIAIETGEVTTLVRDLTAGHLAIATAGIYASTKSGQQIQRVDPVSGAVSLVAGSSTFGSPWVDWHDGTGSGAGFHTISSIAGDSTFVYVNDSGLLRRVDTLSGAVETLAISQFWIDTGPVPANFPGVPAGPWGTLGPIAVRDGHVYAVESSTLDQGTPAIWKYDPTTGSVEKALASTVPNGPATPPYFAGGGSFPSLGFDEQSAPLVVQGHALVRPVIISEQVFVYPAAGNVDQYGDADGLGSVARFTSPQGIWSTGGVDQYVADTSNRKVRRIQMPEPGELGSKPWSKPWIVSTLAGESEHSGSDNGIGENARLSEPHRVVVDDQGAIFVAELGIIGSFYVDQIRRIDPSGATSIVSALPITSPYVLGMAIADGTLFVTTIAAAPLGGPPEGSDLLRLDPSSASWINLDCGQPNDRNYSGIATDGKGQLYVVDGTLGVIDRFDVKAASSACSGGQPAPPATTVATGLTPTASVFKTAFAIFKAFYELAVDGERGVLFVGAEDALEQLDLGTGERSLLAAPEGGWGQIEGLAYDPAGVLYVLPAGDWLKPIGVEAGGAHRISALIVETGEIYDLAGVSGHQGVKLGALPAGVNSPSAIALLPGGELAIADEAEHVVLIAR